MLKKKIKKSSKLLRQKLYLRKKKLLEVYDQLLHTTYYKDLQNLEIEKKKRQKNKIAKQNRNKKKSAEYEIFSDMSLLSHATPYVLYATTAKRKV